MPQREASPGAPDGDWVRKEEKVRPEAAPEGARRCAVARGRYGIVVGAGGQHGVCPVTERTHHRFERNDGVKASGVSDQTRRGGAV